MDASATITSYFHLDGFVCFPKFVFLRQKISQSGIRDVTEATRSPAGLAILASRDFLWFLIKLLYFGGVLSFLAIVLDIKREKAFFCQGDGQLCNAALRTAKF